MTNLTKENFSRVWKRMVIREEAKQRNECLMTEKHISYMPALKNSINFIFQEVA